MTLSSTAALQLVKDDLFPKLQKDREGLDRIDSWMRWDHDAPHSPRSSTKEHKELAARSQTPWLRLVVASVVQSLYVDGFRHTDQADDAASWEWWLRNNMGKRQIAVHQAAIGYGRSYLTVLPGSDSFGESMPIMRGVSPRRMMAYYASPADDDWPIYALRIDPTKHEGHKAWALTLYDANEVHFLIVTDGGGSTAQFIYNGSAVHGVGVCPVVRFTNMLDLEGRADGEVEPLISVAARIDQTSYDRLVVQRFASWVVRTISGMSIDETVDKTNESPAQAKLRLTAADLLVAESENVKFGSLPASPLEGFITARDADIRDLSAVSQTPPHHLLGQIANLSAEALVAAETSHDRKLQERETTLGGSWGQSLRLCARVAGDYESARDFQSQIQWRDTGARSLIQVATALGILAAQLQIPVQMLWERLPGWTQQDSSRAEKLLSSNDPLAEALKAAAAGLVSPAAIQPAA